MTESELRILINLIADTKGADAARDALKEVNREAHGAGDAQAEAGKEGAAAGEKIQSGARGSAREAHELHMILRLLGPQLGELGHLAHLAMFGEVVLAIGAGVIAAKELYEAFEKLQKPIKDFNAALVAIDDAKMAAVNATASELATTLGNIAREEGDIQTKFNQGTTAMDNRIKKYGEEVDAILKVEEAKEKAYEADIDQQVQQGKLTPEQGAAAKENAKLILDQHKGATDQAKLQFEIAQRTDELVKATARVKSGQDDDAVRKAKLAEVPAAEAAAAKKTAAEQVEKGEIKVTGGDLFSLTQHLPGGSTDKTFKDASELKTAIQETKDKIEYLAETGAISPGAKVGTKSAQAEQDKLLKTQLDNLEQALRAHQAYADGLNVESDAAKVALDTAKDKTKQVSEQATIDKNVVVSGPSRIKTLQDQLDLQKKTNDETQAANAQAAATRQATAQQELAKKVAAGTATPAEVDFYNRSVATFNAAGLTGSAAASAAQGQVGAVQTEFSPARSVPATDSSGRVTTEAILKSVAAGHVDVGVLQQAAAHIKNAQDAQAVLDAIHETVVKLSEQMAVSAGLHVNSAATLAAYRGQLSATDSKLAAAQANLAKLEGQVRNLAPNVTR